MGRLVKAMAISGPQIDARLRTGAHAQTAAKAGHDSMPHAASPSLAALAGIRHAFFTREGGVSDGVYASLNGGPGSDDAPANVAENRARMAAALGVPERLLTAYQVHSPDVVTIERPWEPNDRPRADAIVTRAPGLAIGVTTADCGPVLFADATAGVIGAAHAGWRGAAHRRARGDHRRDGAVRRGARPDRRRARADDPPGQLRGRTGIRRPLPGR